MKRALTALILAGAFSHGVAADVTPPSPHDAVAEADTLIRAHLPAAAQHVFEAPGFTWQQHTFYLGSDDNPKTPRDKGATITFMRMGESTLFVAHDPTAREKKYLYRAVDYTRPDVPQDQDQPPKTRCFYPDGSPFAGIDHDGDAVYYRQFFADGTLQEYSVWKSGKWIGGLAVDPTTHEPNWFADGTGALRIFASKPGTFHLTRYFQGGVYLQEEWRDGHRAQISLNVGNDSLTISKAEEKLDFISIYEYWTVKPGKDPYVQIMRDSITSDGKTVPNPVPLKTDIREMMPAMSGRPSEIAKEKAIVEEWKVAYPKRRKLFLDHFAQTLTAAGQTWESLDLAFVRDHAPRP